MKNAARIRFGLISAIGFACVLGGTPALADPPGRHGRMERAQDRQEKRDDWRDFRKIADISRDWKDAMRRHDKRAERAADLRLRTWLEEEQREATREAAEARREARESGSRRDRREAIEETRDLRQVRAVIQELRVLQRKFRTGRAGPREYREKHRLLDRLVEMARQEVRDDRKGGDRHHRNNPHRNPRPR